MARLLQSSTIFVSLLILYLAEAGDSPFGAPPPPPPPPPPSNPPLTTTTTTAAIMHGPIESSTTTTPASSLTGSNAGAQNQNPLPAQSNEGHSHNGPPQNNSILVSDNLADKQHAHSMAQTLTITSSLLFVTAAIFIV